MEQEIILLEKEKNLFDFLLAFIQEEKLNVVLRVAGGWVRDKLMGQHSHDIDIALDTMMGE
jgi:tRNA nucleotidyltransferase (CCA-adding enzyme)